jgi:PAS domain S-box-containing protein
MHDKLSPGRDGPGTKDFGLSNFTVRDEAGWFWNRFQIDSGQRLIIAQIPSNLIIGLLLGASYFVIARFGLAFAIPPGNATAVWPASGLAMAAILLFGYRVSWGIWLGASFAAATTGISYTAAALIGVGNTLEAILAAWIFRKYIDPESPFDKASEGFRFAMITAVSASVSATWGVFTLFLTGYVPSSGLLANWKTWWLGDVAGLMVVAPLILSLLETKRQASVKVSRLLVIANIVLLFAIGFGIFGGLLPQHIAQNLLYVTVIYLIWVAISFRFRYVTIAITFLSALAIWGASRGVGPYYMMTVQDSLFDLQLFISLYALTGLTLAGLVSRRREILADLQSMNFALDQSAIVTVTDPEGIIKRVNDKFCEISKFSREELLHRTPPLSDSENQLKRLFRDIVNQKNPGDIWRGEISCLAKDGATFWSDTTIVPFLDENNNPKEYLSICFDITERKLANKQSRRLFQAVEKTTDIVFITDLSGRIEYANPAFETITGFRNDEILGQTPRIMKSGRQSPEYYRKLWSTILGGKVHSSTVVNCRKNGEYFHAEQTITPVKNKDGKITNFVSVLKDITELLEKQEHEVALRLARQVQQSYYKSTVSVAGYDIAGFASPADETGGDYFDFIRLPNDGLALVIGDVSGHGISAALIMAETRAYLRSCAGTCCDVGSMLTSVNRALVHDLAPDRFVTLLVVCLDPIKKAVTFSGAGHEPGFLLNPSGSIASEFTSNGPPLGLLSDISYSSSDPVELSKDQAILLLTDGITETPLPDGYAFGTRQAIKYFNTHRDRSARQISEGLCRAVEAHAADQKLQDDITSVVLKVL